MLSILIIDDSERKIQTISELLLDYDEITDNCITICKNIITAKRTLRSKVFDLVILDMQLPFRDGDIPNRTAGVELLMELHTRSSYKKPYCIVGLTGYLDIYDEVYGVFSDQLWSIVLYADNSTEWSNKLCTKIEYIIETKKTNIEDRYRIKLGIVTALNTPEFDAVLRLGDCTEVLIDGDPTRYYRCEYSSGTKRISAIAACAPQMGMSATAVLSTKLISHFHPKYLAMVGITAGVKGKVNIGDIIIGDPTWDWGSGKRKYVNHQYVFEPDPLQERLHPQLKALFLDVQRENEMLRDAWISYDQHKPNNEPTLQIGPCSSGSCVLGDGVTIQTIREHNRKLLGVDMEAYGLMHAAANSIEPYPLAFSLKAVCDFGNPKKNDKYQEYAAYMSSYVLYRIALKYF